MKDRECLHCQDFFDCVDGKPNNARCINFRERTNNVPKVNSTPENKQEFNFDKFQSYIHWGNVETEDD